MKSDKELADQLDAEDRLRGRGYEKQICPKCNGYGQFGSVVCWQCEGKGHIWKHQLRSEGNEDGG
jgi:DnaJ-class molecular chaperone